MSKKTLAAIAKREAAKTKARDKDLKVTVKVEPTTVTTEAPKA